MLIGRFVISNAQPSTEQNRGMPRDNVVESLLETFAFLCRSAGALHAFDKSSRRADIVKLPIRY